MQNDSLTVCGFTLRDFFVQNVANWHQSSTLHFYFIDLSTMLHKVMAKCITVNLKGIFLWSTLEISGNKVSGLIGFYLCLFSSIEVLDESLECRYLTRYWKWRWLLIFMKYNRGQNLDGINLVGIDFHLILPLGHRLWVYPVGLDLLVGRYL